MTERMEPRHGWLVKYALTTGITEGEFAPGQRSDWTFVYGVRPDGRLDLMMGAMRTGRDVFWSAAEAEAAARAARDRKVASLRKQIARLESLTFGEGQS